MIPGWNAPNQTSIGVQIAAVWSSVMRFHLGISGPERGRGEPRERQSVQSLQQWSFGERRS